MFLLGYDVGSSSVKATLINAETGKVTASATSPQSEMEIAAVKPGWAEQDPQMWWQNIKSATATIKRACPSELAAVKAIGISYQMHGLVLVGDNMELLRPAIIWCDSRAVSVGQQAFNDIGPDICREHLLNSPGNFTASKLAWVKQNEPDIFTRIKKVMLPGDYIAARMSGEIKTTVPGLSEAILWDYKNNALADIVLDYFQIPRELIPDIVPAFAIQGILRREIAEELSLPVGVPVSYRAGDQPNNAFALNVLEPGEIAATAGTSGVVYGVGTQAAYDAYDRVNTFVHVNHTAKAARYGVLLCLNGAGILNRWVRQNIAGDNMSYEQINQLASRSPAGANGLIILPYGNGAERTLGNSDIGCSFHNINFNIHNRSDIFRAAQEGVAFAMNYGLNIMRNMGLEIKTIRAGFSNMFLSDVFATAFATVSSACVQLYDTDGAQGAARGAGMGCGIYSNMNDAFVGLRALRTVEPADNNNLSRSYQHAYQLFESVLEKYVHYA